MAGRNKKRSPHRPGSKNRRKRTPQRPPARDNPEYQRRFKGSQLAAQLLESMIDNLEGAVKCIHTELGDIFQVDYPRRLKKGRANIYLKLHDDDSWCKERKHAHFVVKVKEDGNELVSITHWGRTWS